MSNEEIIKADAIDYAKRNKIRIAKELTDPAIYAHGLNPISVFMAGSPGAGKTEFSKNLIQILEGDKERSVVRIDGDEIRPLIPEYTGKNSYLFQGAVSLIVEKMHDLVLHNKQSFILDGTFSKYEKAVDNIVRSLVKKRTVIIFYIYQSPEIAWKFTKAREKIEGRNIPKSAFIEQFLGARDVVNRVSVELGDKLAIFLVKKDFEKNSVENIIKLNEDTRHIDEYMQKHYTKEYLEEHL
ncbi:AAA family ATPase [Candidatus Berkelbacteria bacterium]|uniref:Zeta toxin n=1 Tax=Candidatus Berkelbacteria bacterium CG10_big_fil_rev_8_21_14_0_10_43_14 TaxID=1974515 RepID=A0A2M6R881_9BACT|nr:AAA family ATPase [Candidatus Berkelbacteria bacterium]OIP07204.1 MAG: hypothetical protein AUK41_00220 [Candidatus Berkelbacteria bacterium CG2_30_43_20]PIS06745.1 MAG: Zeta toxin [Candidatus Berkelbacteria bacterium CG10_big_fil_rev_8_21_14_0_10_43_14]PIU87544.1 MAG: Zeta toxin [Candidatus Berkelbacteria bacterium CG06_land_8_20_14_3_00_43_10]